MSRPAPKANSATSKAKPRPKPKRVRFPWIPFVLLLGTIYLFWILPVQQGPQPTKVNFSDGK